MSLPPLLLIDKPAGMSSFDVIRQLRRRTGVRKFGHAGTLDPAATGLMLIGVEQGTKQLHELIKLDKEYEAEILLGERRSTGDMDGEVLDSKAYQNDLTETQLRSVLNSMLGTMTLPVSVYSAIKKGGVPMYKRARKAAARGEVIEDVPLREMTVRSVRLGSVTDCVISGESRLLVQVIFGVESGTYIRSLAEEFGRRVGYPATLHALRRTQIGKFRIEDAQKLEEF